MPGTFRPCRGLWWESERRGCSAAGAWIPTIACGADSEGRLVNKSSTGRAWRASGLVEEGNVGIVAAAQLAFEADEASAEIGEDARGAVSFPSRRKAAAVNANGVPAFIPSHPEVAAINTRGVTPTFPSRPEDAAEFDVSYPSPSLIAGAMLTRRSPMAGTLGSCRGLWWESERRGCSAAGAWIPTVACGTDPEGRLVNKSSTGRAWRASVGNTREGTAASSSPSSAG
jgi:hypothetical protein